MAFKPVILEGADQRKTIIERHLAWTLQLALFPHALQNDHV